MMSILFSFLVLVSSGICSIQKQRTLEVRFDQETRSLLAQSDSSEGAVRILLYLQENKEQNPEFPADGPFPLAPGPVIAWELSRTQMQDVVVSGTLTLGAPQASYPEPFESISGHFRGQLALVLDGGAFDQQDPEILKSHVSEVVLELDGSRTLEITFKASRRDPVETPDSEAHVHIVTVPSPLLAQNDRRRDAREAAHRAFVILPQAYDELAAPRRRWPVIYVIPGSETALERARTIAKILHEPRMKELVPQAIWVVLDPDSDYGHHFFVDSQLQGARARALVTELIPWLDVRYRTIPRADARLLLGEEEGGRAALTLLLDFPEVFSNAWALSPEAVSFEALGCLDLLRDENAFLDSNDSQRPAFRTVLSQEREIVHLDVKDEILLSTTISADGRSGQKWDALRAAFGSLQTKRNLARWPFDPTTGRRRPGEIMHWMTMDLTEKVRGDGKLAERLTKNARVFVGENDERYRNLGVRQLEQAVERTLADDVSQTTEWVVRIEGADRTSANAIARLPVHDEIITVLRNRDLHD